MCQYWPMTTQTSSVNWRTELIAGATVFAVLVPSALAYSAIVGVPPIIGLVGVPLALVAYALVGGSSIVIVGADAAVSVMVASTVAGVSPTDDQYLTAVAVVSVLVGLIFLAFRALRLGWVADLIPEPVLKGFVQGLVWTTIVGQVPALLGLTLAQSSSNTVIKLWYTLQAIDTVQIATATLGVASLVVLLGLSRIRHGWPNALIVLVLAGIAYAVLGLSDRGVGAVGAPTGSLVNTSFALPDRLSDWSGLLVGALAIVLLAFTEHLGAVEMVADARNERVTPNRELLGLGVANLAVGAGSSFAVTGALSKTSVSIESGARTKWAAAFTAVLAVLAALALRPMFDYLANTVLAAIVVWAMIGMIDLNYLKWLATVSRVEFSVAALAFIGVIGLGVMPAVAVATVLALVLLGRRIGRPDVVPLTRRANGRWRAADDDSDDNTVGPDDAVVFRVRGPMLFLNARVLADSLRTLAHESPGSVIVVDCSEMSIIDTTASRSLRSALRAVTDDRVDVRLAALDPVIEKRMKREAELDGMPIDVCFETIDDAVDGVPS